MFGWDCTSPTEAALLPVDEVIRFTTTADYTFRDLQGGSRLRWQLHWYRYKRSHGTAHATASRAFCLITGEMNQNPLTNSVLVLISPTIVLDLVSLLGFANTLECVVYGETFTAEVCGSAYLVLIHYA